MKTVIQVLQNFSKSQAWGGALLLFILALGLFQPLFHDTTIFKTDLHNALSGPTRQEPLGKDHLGRSMLARIGAAIRLSIGLAVVSVLTAAIPGIFLGVAAGWRGGWLDRCISLMADTVAALPGLLLILIFSALAPGSFLVLYTAISLVLWLEFFRVVRAQTRVLSASSAVESSQMLGFGKWYCFRKHIWPGLAPNLLPLAALGGGNAIIALATLGFVNVGVQPPVAELGLMMTELFPYIYDAPFILFQPILVVFLLVLSLNLLTRRKNDESNPVC
jgi:peptide/nickel transport system permease protein